MAGSNRTAVRHDRDMREKRSWPVRYLVTIRSSLGQTRKLYVLTWLGPEKALAMAAHADGHGFGTSDGIYDIEVAELGPAERDDRGLVLLEGHLSDRMEF
jgi:hypothetical protein